MGKLFLWIALGFLAGDTFGQRPAFKTFSDSSFIAGDRILFPKIIYPGCKPALRPEDKDSLGIVIDFMKHHPKLKFQIAVHTDIRGSAATNLKTSDKHARQLLEELVALGADSSRLIAKGYGESNPVIDEVMIHKAKTKEEKEAFALVKQEN